jgi:hypothetical protein
VPLVLLEQAVLWGLLARKDLKEFKVTLDHKVPRV